MNAYKKKFVLFLCFLPQVFLSFCGFVLRICFCLLLTTGVGSDFGSELQLRYIHNPKGIQYNLTNVNLLTVELLGNVFRAGSHNNNV